jgi:hypothetical protein
MRTFHLSNEEKTLPTHVLRQTRPSVSDQRHPDWMKHGETTGPPQLMAPFTPRRFDVKINLQAFMTGSSTNARWRNVANPTETVKK